MDESEWAVVPCDPRSGWTTPTVPVCSCFVLSLSFLSLGSPSCRAGNQLTLLSNSSLATERARVQLRTAKGSAGGQRGGAGDKGPHPELEQGSRISRVIPGHRGPACEGEPRGQPEAPGGGKVSARSHQGWASQ